MIDWNTVKDFFKGNKLVGKVEGYSVIWVWVSRRKSTTRGLSNEFKYIFCDSTTYTTETSCTSTDSYFFLRWGDLDEIIHISLALQLRWQITGSLKRQLPAEIFSFKVDSQIEASFKWFHMSLFKYSTFWILNITCSGRPVLYYRGYTQVANSL